MVPVRFPEQTNIRVLSVIRPAVVRRYGRKRVARVSRYQDGSLLESRWIRAGGGGCVEIAFAVGLDNESVRPGGLPRTKLFKRSGGARDVLLFFFSAKKSINQVYVTIISNWFLLLDRVPAPLPQTRRERRDSLVEKVREVKMAYCAEQSVVTPYNFIDYMVLHCGQQDPPSRARCFGHHETTIPTTQRTPPAVHRRHQENASPLAQWY